jgi:hypothetical protein
MGAAVGRSASFPGDLELPLGARLARALAWGRRLTPKRGPYRWVPSRGRHVAPVCVADGGNGAIRGRRLARNEFGGPDRRRLDRRLPCPVAMGNRRVPATVRPSSRSGRHGHPGVSIEAREKRHCALCTLAEEQAPPTWPRRDEKSSAFCEQLRSGAKIAASRYPNARASSSQCVLASKRRW